MQYSSPWYFNLFTSKNELKLLLKGTGWKVIKFIDSKDFHHDGKYMAIMAKEKPK